VKQFKLRGDLTIVEQTYRDQQSYIVKEHVEHRYYAFSVVEVLVMQQFDGEQTCAAIADGLAEQGLAIKEAAVESFARKLNSMGLLEQSVAERSILLMERVRAQRNRRVKAAHYRGSFLRMRWSVGDPNEFFNRWTPRLGFFFSAPFIAISIALFVAYFGIVISRHEVFLSALRAMYDPSSWTFGFFAVFWVTGITVIAIHEFGHGFACKYFGGDVHEMGAMLIYLQPAFYCNVNDAWTFPELKARLWVTAAGSWIQMVVAGLAAIVWWAVEPDTLISQVALIAVLIGGAMTLLANANPLIPLDGYYALSDFLGVPNLRKRAFQHVEYAFKHHVLRLDVPGVQASPREKRIFLVYGLLALAYSGTLLTLFFARFIGWVAGSLGALGMIVLAMVVWVRIRDWLGAIWRGAVQNVREHPGAWRWFFRPRGVAAAAAVIAAGVFVPWTIHVGGSFVAFTPVYVALTAPGQGTVAQVFASEGGWVAAGAPIIMVRDIEGDRLRLVLTRQVDSLSAREARARAEGNESDVRRLSAQRAELVAALAALRDRTGGLDLRAPMAGIIVTRRFEEMTGRPVVRGDTLAELIGAGDSVELRVSLEGAGATRVRAGQPASVISFGDLSVPLMARVAAVAEAGTPHRSATAGPTILEARIRVRASPAWRPGVTGRASIAILRTNLFGALWWNVRKRVRTDLLM